MKNKFKRKSVSLLSIVLIMIFSLFLFNQHIYASEALQINGTEFGLEVISKDDIILSELKILPGKVVDSKVIIKNNGFNTF